MTGHYDDVLHWRCRQMDREFRGFFLCFLLRPPPLLLLSSPSNCRVICDCVLVVICSIPGASISFTFSVLSRTGNNSGHFFIIIIMIIIIKGEELWIFYLFQRMIRLDSYVLFEWNRAVLRSFERHPAANQTRGRLQSFRSSFVSSALVVGCNDICGRNNKKI